jgi:hypothetical protein
MAWHLEASTISLINPMAAELYYYTWVAQGVTDTIIVIATLILHQGGLEVAYSI